MFPLQNHLQVLLLLVFEAVVYRRQQYYRKQHQLVAPVTESIFEDVSRDHLDRGLVPCAKYFLNYFYYKFGLEVGSGCCVVGGLRRWQHPRAEPLHAPPQICFLVMVNVIGQRMNFVVILHGCWLVVILLRRRREAIAHLWPKYCLFLVVFFLYQYLLCLGMPPALCVGKGTPVLCGGHPSFVWGREVGDHVQARCLPGYKGLGVLALSVPTTPDPRLSMALEPGPPHQLGAHQVALPARLLCRPEFHQPHQ